LAGIRTGEAGAGWAVFIAVFLPEIGDTSL